MSGKTLDGARLGKDECGTDPKPLPWGSDAALQGSAQGTSRLLGLQGSPSCCPRAQPGPPEQVSPSLQTGEPPA